MTISPKVYVILKIPIRGSHPFLAGLTERFKGKEAQDKGRSGDKKRLINALVVTLQPELG